MSSLWTPSGEHHVPRQGDGPAGTPPPPPPPPGGQGEPPGTGEPAEAQEMAELRAQLVATPVEVVVANHAYGLFELAALHLEQRPPRLEQAKTAIDAMGALVEGLAGRLGAAEPDLLEGLATIRMAYVQVSGAVSTSPDGS